MDEGPCKKKQRLGIQQRIKEEKAKQDKQSKRSVVADFLLYMFSWGFFSAQLVQKIAALILEDLEVIRSGGEITGLKELAELGSKGLHAKNVHRDISKVTDSVSLMPKPFMVNDIPFKAGIQTQAILLPHIIFSTIFHQYPHIWKTAIMPSEERLQQFWKAQKGSIVFENHPARNDGDLMSKCIPLGMHGDEVPITGRGKCWCKLLLSFEWLSLIGFGGRCYI